MKTRWAGRFGVTVSHYATRDIATHSVHAPSTTSLLSPSNGTAPKRTREADSLRIAGSSGRSRGFRCIACAMYTTPRHHDTDATQRSHVAQRTAGHGDPVGEQADPNAATRLLHACQRRGFRIVGRPRDREGARLSAVPVLQRPAHITPRRAPCGKWHCSAPQNDGCVRRSSGHYTDTKVPTPLDSASRYAQWATARS